MASTWAQHRRDSSDHLILQHSHTLAACEQGHNSLADTAAFSQEDLTHVYHFNSPAGTVAWQPDILVSELPGIPICTPQQFSDSLSWTLSQSAPEISMFPHHHNSAASSPAGYTHDSNGGSYVSSATSQASPAAHTPGVFEGPTDISKSPLLSPVYHTRTGRSPSMGSINQLSPGGVSRSTSQTRARSIARGTSYACPTCHRVSKNSSEAEKHRLQHVKPYTCSDTTCKKHRDGFATRNDLERHRKSVHGASPEVGEKVSYVCAACPSQPFKVWPRKDNFRAHCSRKHADWDQTVLLERSKKDVSPRAASGRGSLPASDDMSDDGGRITTSLYSNSAIPPRTLDGHIFSSLLPSEAEELAGVGGGQMVSMGSPTLILPIASSSQASPSIPSHMNSPFIDDYSERGWHPDFGNNGWNSMH